MVKQGLKWIVGTGMCIKVYSDAWITDIPLEREVWPIVCALQCEKPRVAQFIDKTKEWDMNKLKELFVEDIVSRICKIPIP